MRSEKESLIVQARLDGFSLNKLSPYINWRSLREEARSLWQPYLGVARPLKVKRLAVRYTNRIEMPVGHNFKEALLTAPEIAPGIPQGLPEYFIRLVIPHPSGSTAIVTEASTPTPTGQDKVSMICDIDAFRITDLRPDDDRAIWTTLDELRAYKNVIFFNSITPAQLERYS